MAGRILVVDGVPTNRITMKVRLASACHEVATAASGQDALRMARLIHPRIVLIGANLPDMDGPALCAALRALPQGAETPVLVQARGEDRVAALSAGASGLIEPNDADLTLLARIRGLMRHEPGAETGALEAPVSGLAEAAAGFAHDDRPRAVFVADSPATALGWRHALQGRVGFAIAIAEPERALAEAASDRVADLYLIAADVQQPGDGLRLLSELRSRPHSRDAAFVVALRPERAEMAPVALDLGAGDVLAWSLASPGTAPEAAMRLEAQLARKREADRRRHETRRNMRWAMTDPLTGLHNRRYALPRLAELAAEAQEAGRDFAVMLLDIDRFKQVNDVYGHPAGDAVLGEVATRLASALPADALLARIGGEEFLVALPDCPARSARRVAEALRQAVMAEPVCLPPGCDSAALGVTVSVGVAVGQAGPGCGWPAEPETLLACADRALLNAKSSGRNRIVVAPQMAHA
ncbi:diguanylate cyclase [Paracoccus sp. TOH]|uniref:diguanylate cyclase n=1 Tax=Paracoccus sp. TOH TaxID=1263728 RepID=UPI0025AED69F|nr:diguanylate cyclase [Paracoccus sp. TOH]WJS85569.1 diguanylate cyclase [Paracoccus sp. TOH]